MSRLAMQSGRPSFQSKMGFDALTVESGESSDSEVEEQEQELEVTPPPPAPVIKEPPSKPVDPPQPSTSKSSAKSAKRAAKKAANKSAGGSPKASDGDSSLEVAPPAALVPEPEANGVSEPGEPPAQSTLFSQTVPSILPARPLSAANTQFQPNLPESLPQPISPGLGPRKRKASRDLTSNPLTKESKVENGNGNGVTVATTEKGEKIGVVQLGLQEAVSQDTVIAQEKAKAKQNVVTRTIWTLIMIAGFLVCLSGGPVYMILLVMFIQTQVYREVTNLFVLTSKNKDEPLVTERKGRDPWSKTLNWYFFAAANYFLYGESMVYYFKHVVYADVRFLPFANNHRIISFMLWVFGFMGFVASLKKQFLRQQFGLFCWVHMSLMVIVASSHFIIDNILEGMIWFWVPASLVICNDIFAYIWGKTFGRTQLIALSPKKTVEGFVGAFFSTLIFGLVWATFFMRFNYMICPAVDLGMNVLSNVQCEPNPAFIWRTYLLPAPVQAIISPFIQIPPIPWAPFQIHALVMATFASLVAPFGGFFASGFKRAFNLKDFGDSIPGHGGLTDRMDCQFLMGMFAYVYYTSAVRIHRETVGSVMQTIVSSLTLEEQLTLFHDLKYYLEGLGSEVAQLL